ncbi:MAG TPA: hypothetical protein VN802_08580 [Stellaceae bacterium]|nr:hypothetical protein [Stellaceae bacterium]
MLHDPLSALAELERRYDGPIPEPLRLVARLGSPSAARRLHAEAKAAFFAALAKGQIRAIRRRRGAGSLYPALFDDLALYRRERRHWRRAARLLASGGTG